MNMEGDIMEKCPNCKNSLCVNPYFTQTLNFLDLMIESNLFELESSEENFIEYSGAISVTCKNSEFVFEYADEDLEYLDN